MKKEFDDILCKDFPKIFKSRHGKPTETLMCFGFECGDGWYPLIYKLCSQLQWDIDNNGEPQIEALQVKEKFGRLCFYVTQSSDRQRAQISFAESMSIWVCERCGKFEPKTMIKEGAQWIYNACDECWAKNKGRK